METRRFHVRGAELQALVFGDPAAANTALAAHGLTSSAISFASIARRLPGDWRLVSLDLRGRGGSAGQPGPYGVDAHAADLVAVARRLETRSVLTGHSLGAYAALRAAAGHAELFTGLVLVDGGLPPPAVNGADLLGYTVTPTVTRLGRTFADEDDYIDFYRRQPALAHDWSPEIETYIRYDICGGPGAVRSRTDPASVRADIADLLANGDLVAADLIRLTLPARLFHASAGMLGRPPGMLPKGNVDGWTRKAPMLTARLLDGVNHFTIVLADSATAQIAAEIASIGDRAR
ncbi:alpha/beta fold hydrolase [Phytomonospora endophytica]|uniref:Pimeloyl-ACP methyl ester carboxylesterase n=1 Tax=Phytomonospora endophytica TaxID=714109 RepID=A0A841FKF5_9ACTN|nr:alpha/beta hydrolase [Phytomonospora endophytica]MBB6035413.1 pimeloyl-ACP methyl ester carboxylesterase [Phytomonospora endophytica]GIG63835.1 hypothetical protein Pen01_01300 [Phytomonospora endophytica]